MARKALTPICALVFLEFVAMGLPLSILPVHVHATMQLGSFMVGLVVGLQSWATLLTRHAAGTWSDQRGPRSATLRGLSISALAGVLYAASTAPHGSTFSLALLLAGRAMLGLGESLVITGALAWGVALVGRERSGLVMSWIGIAMYAALALGAPLGALLHADYGFRAMSLAAAAAPLLALVPLSFAKPVAPIGGVRLPFHRVVGLIAWPGLGLTLSALGFGAIAAFSALRFREAGFSHAPLAMSSFGVAYVLARVFFGGLPDKLGGARVAAASAAVAAVGQLGMWLAPSGALAIGAAALTGLGFSLAFPSFGVEAMRRVPPQSRGAALGAYAACFDLTMGLGVPLLGAVVSATDYGVAFAVSGVAALGSMAMAIGLGSRGAPMPVTR